jgi:eukaryotic-like serine/threonine-protein kinase
MDDVQTDDAAAITGGLDHRLRVERPELGSALDRLQARVVAVGGGLAPRSIGRYRLRRVIGSGAFGTVYEADDPELDRRVAVKVLTVRSRKEATRVIREAQLLATLSHPNIVQVFEVGAIDEGHTPYVVMELVEGPTLRAWSSKCERSWREVLEVLLAVGRGVWTAHRAGIIHRDLKPENVLIGTDGRARVIDFGLALFVDDAPGSERASTLRSGPGPGTSVRLTATGQVMGTPAYMAPEVFKGRFTPLSDQFALCVTLYEALFGKRPFEANTVDDLRAKVLAREARAPARQRTPRRIVAIVLRGLRRAPEERFGDLGQLIDALERASRTRRWLPAIPGLVVLGGGLAIVSMDSPSEPLAESCAVGDAAWARFHRDAKIPETLTSQLADYQRQWQETEQALCSAGPIDWERRRCLDRGLRDVAALVSVVRDMDAREANQAVARLTEPAQCAALARDQITPPPPSLEPEVARLEQRMSSLRALTATAQIKAGVEESERLLAEARELGYAPLLADIAYLRGWSLLLGSDYEGSRAVLEEAFFIAQRHGMAHAAIRAAGEIVRVTGYYLADLPTARLWVAHAETAYRRAGLDPSADGRFQESLAGLAEREGDLEGATEILRRALAAVIEAGDDETLLHAGLTNHLGIVLYRREACREAIVHQQTAASIYERLHGHDSPSHAAVLDAIGLCSLKLGDHHAAHEHHLAALEIRKATLAPDHLDLGGSYGNMGQALQELGRYDESLEYLDRAVDLFTKRRGSDHPDVAMALMLRATTHERRGPVGRESALRDYEQAARLYENAGDGFAEDAARIRASMQALASP